MSIMKQLCLFLFLLLPFTAVAGQRKQGVTTFTLANGMSVWLSEDHTQPKVFGAVVVKAGAKDCPNSGIAHYLEHLLFKGTQKIGTIDYVREKPWLDSIAAQYDRLAATVNPSERLAIQRHINNLSLHAADYAIPNEFSQLISRFGGTELNAYTSFDETVFHNIFSPQYMRQWCELNAERLKDPVFRLFQGELETVYEEKNMYADNLLASTAEKAQQIALAGTPYAYPIIGATDSLKNPRLTEMMCFFRERYIPENMGLMLCGDFCTDSLRPLLEQTFGTLRAASRRQPALSPVASLRDFTHMPLLRLKVPVPIVKIGGRAWKAPGEKNADYSAFKVMTSMLVNDDRTGLIDSLMVSGRLLFAAGMGYDFKDFSAWGFGYVPRLPFGSRTKADRLCLVQIDKLRRGDFTDDALRAAKLTLKRNAELCLETINGRSKAMINAFSHGIDWQSVEAEGDNIDGVTRADVMRVAGKYLGDDCLRIAKRFGSYPKERLKQPGYKPVEPKNAGRQSAFASRIAREPVEKTLPRFIDFDKDAAHIPLAPLVNLYTTSNPRNDIFTLRIIYRRGVRDDRRLDAMADYLNDIGTVRYDKHAFAGLLRGYGATLEAEASSENVTLTLTGIDRYLGEAMGLLGEFLAHAKADRRQFRALVKSEKIGGRTFFKQNSNIARAMMQKLMRGSSSDYLSRLSSRELERMSGDSLVSLFHQLQHWQTDLVYCGSRDTKEVENIIKRNMVLHPVHPWKPAVRKLLPVDENTVYLFDNPSARQTIVGSYECVAPMSTPADRAQLLLWGNYFGSGMQSVLFQEVREFRSLAYSAHGSVLLPDLLTRGGEPCGYVSLIGTQADKATTTALLLDSLLMYMPLRPMAVETARLAIVNSVNNNFPSYRQIGSTIASYRLHGYVRDPDADIVGALDTLNARDLQQFYDRHVRTTPRAIIIVGNRKKLDMRQLGRLGKVVELKRKDIYHE